MFFSLAKITQLALAKFALIFIVLANISTAQANECFSEFSNFNICDAARKIQTEIAPNLPMQLSQNLFLTKVTSFGPQLNLYANLGYDEKYFEDALSSQGASRIVVENYMKLIAKNKLCTDEVTEAFLGFGGTIFYDYSFIDGVTYMQFSVDINNCDKSG